MSTRLSLFDSPLLLGFDQFERVLDRVQKSSGDNFPHYNIEQIGDNGIRITLAVAGFTMDDLQVTLEDNQLLVRGKQEDDPNRQYIHRGIAARQFQRAFVLADGIEVMGASLQHGLLSIDLMRPQPAQKVREIAITETPDDSPRAPTLSVSAQTIKSEDA